jgi:hypothetical protein
MPKLIKPVELKPICSAVFYPRLAAVELGDVTELAVEGAAAREFTPTWM